MSSTMNKCPICGYKGQLLFLSFDCTNPSCDNYKDQYPEIKIIENEDEFHLFDHLDRKFREKYIPYFSEPIIKEYFYHNRFVGKNIKDIRFSNPASGYVIINIEMINNTSYSDYSWACYLDKYINHDYIKPAGFIIEVKINE